MVEHELDALVVRAPDNVLYLSNYLCMKGYDLVVFPRAGDPTLIVLEPQEEDAHRTPSPPMRHVTPLDLEESGNRGPGRFGGRPYQPPRN